MRATLRSLLLERSFNLDAFMAAQSDGLYFDTTKTDRFFQENTGPSLADDVGEAIGLAMSQRAWNGKTLSQIASEAPELVVNGTFATDLDGWADRSDSGASAVWESPGRVRLISFTGVAGRVRQGVPTDIGALYRLAWEAEGSAVLCGIGSTDSNANGVLADNVAPTVAGMNYRYFVATSTTSYINLRRATANASAWADNVSVKKILGRPGVQATGTLKPVRQTAGAKFDGSDDSWLTSYTPGEGDNFIVALVTVPASVSATQIITGVSDAAMTAEHFFFGVTNTGLMRIGVGTDLLGVGSDMRDQEIVVGLTNNGTNIRAFQGSAEAYSGAQTGAINTATALRLGALNASGGTAASFFGGSIKKLVAGRQFLDLTTYQQIRNALLT